MQPVACRLLDCFLFSIPPPSLLQSLVLSLSHALSLSCTLHPRYTYATLTLHSRLALHSYGMVTAVLLQHTISQTMKNGGGGGARLAARGA